MLHHANIVHVFELGEEDHEYFMTMEFVHGVDLDKLIDTGRKPRRKRGSRQP